MARVPRAKFHREHRGRLYCGGPEVVQATRAHPHDFILKDVTQRVHAVDADIGNGSTAGHGGIIDPGSGVSGSRGEGKFGARENNLADLSGGHPVAQTSRALLEAKNLGNAQQQLCAAGRFYHRAAFTSADAHGLFTQHRLATAQSKLHVGQVAGIGSGDKNGIDFRRLAQLLGRIECQRDIVLPGGLARLIQGASRQPGDAAVLRQRETWHQPLDRVQSKPENAEANHQSECVDAGRPRPRLLQLI